MSFIAPAVIFVESQATTLLAFIGLGTAPLALQLGVLAALSALTIGAAVALIYGIVLFFRNDDSYSGPSAPPVDYSGVTSQVYEPFVSSSYEG